MTKRSLEELLAEEDCGLRMLGRPLTEEHGWSAMGYPGCEVLEYREPDDTLGVRTMRVTRPAGTWTVGLVCQMTELIERTISGRAAADDSDDAEHGSGI